MDKTSETTTERTLEIEHHFIDEARTPTVLRVSEQNVSKVLRNDLNFYQGATTSRWRAKLQMLPYSSKTDPYVALAESDWKMRTMEDSVEETAKRARDLRASIENKKKKKKKKKDKTFSSRGVDEVMRAVARETEMNLLLVKVVEDIELIAFQGIQRSYPIDKRAKFLPVDMCVLSVSIKNDEGEVVEEELYPAMFFGNSQHINHVGICKAIGQKHLGWPKDDSSVSETDDSSGGE